jgi:hypothetical protein
MIKKFIRGPLPDKASGFNSKMARSCRRVIGRRKKAGELSIREISNGPFCDNYDCR